MVRALRSQYPCLDPHRGTRRPTEVAASASAHASISTPRHGGTPHPSGFFCHTDVEQPGWPWSNLLLREDAVQPAPAELREREQRKVFGRAARVSRRQRVRG